MMSRRMTAPILAGLLSLVGCGVQPASRPALAPGDPVSIPGSIRDYNGERVAGTLVAVHDVFANTTVVLTTDAQGEYSIETTEGRTLDVRIDAYTPAFGNNGYMQRFVVASTSTAHFIDGFNVSLPVTLEGTSGADVLKGTPGPDVIVGLGGDDVIVGQGDDDVLIGGAGNDQLRGRNGADRLSGGDGDDQLFGDAGADYLRGWAGDDALHGGAGKDHLLNERGSDSAAGDAGDDQIEENSGQTVTEDINLITGGDGNDEIGLAQTNALVNGGAGDDIVMVSYGPDTNVHVDCGDGADIGRRNSGFVPDTAYTNCEQIEELA